MQEPDDLSVSEAGYTGADRGPTADTESFCQATPAPGQRVLYDGPGSMSHSSTGDRTVSGNLPSLPLSGAGRHIEPDDDGRLPIPLILAAGLFLCAVTLAGVVAVQLLSAEAPEEPAPAEEVDEVMGVPVEKGFKKRSG